MGMFDTVFAECPACKTRVEFQSKAGVCDLKRYRVDSVPPEVARDIDGDSKTCGNCGLTTIIALYTPIPRVIMVLESEDDKKDWD